MENELKLCKSCAECVSGDMLAENLLERSSKIVKELKDEVKRLEPYEIYYNLARGMK